MGRYTQNVHGVTVIFMEALKPSEDPSLDLLNREAVGQRKERVLLMLRLSFLTYKQGK